MPVENKAVSLDEQSSMVRRAFADLMEDRAEAAQTPGSMSDIPAGEDELTSYWLMDVYTDYVVACDNMGLCYQVGFTTNADGVTFASREQWVKVEKEWVEAKGIDTTFVRFGGDVKSLGDGKFAGFLVQYTTQNDPDLTYEYFDAKSDLDVRDGDAITIYYNHGRDRKLDNAKIGHGTLKMTDEGVWLDGQIEMHDRYLQKYAKSIQRLLDDGYLGLSSGPAQHLIRKTPQEKAVHIDAWPIKEASLSPTRAEFRNMAIPLKSIPFADLDEEVKSLSDDAAKAQPEAQPPEAAQAVAVAGDVTPRIEVLTSHETPSNEEITIMTDQVPAVPPVEGNGVEASVKALSDRFDAYLKKMEATPAAEGSVISNFGGKQDSHVKSFADFALAVSRGDETRLNKVYQTKAVQEDQGSTGGYYVPPSFSAELVAAQAIVSPIISLCRNIPVQSPAGMWPVLSLTQTPTAGSGNTALAAGLISSNIAEGGSYTARQVYFDEVNFRVGKHGDIVDVSAEMMDDAPQLDGLLRALMTTALAAKKERNILTGTGVGEPLGILNAPALINVTKHTASHFDFTDVGTMLSRFKMLSGDPGRIAWIAHPSVIPDILTLQVGTTTSAVTYTTNISTGSMDMPIMQRPLYRSEHLPQLAANGDVILADLGAYVIWTRGEMSISFSKDYKFGSGLVTWRFDERYDAQPWLKSSITLAGAGSAFTQSPFVQHFYA